MTPSSLRLRWTGLANFLAIVDSYCSDISSAYPSLAPKLPACSLAAVFNLVQDPPACKQGLAQYWLLATKKTCDKSKMIDFRGRSEWTLDTDKLILFLFLAQEDTNSHDKYQKNWLDLTTSLCGTE